MSEVIATALTKLQKRVAPGDMDFSVRFDVGDEGHVRLDETGVSESNADADLVMSGDPEVFAGILNGSVNPATALMSGQLSIDGDMSLAMKLGSVLTS